MWIIIWKNVYDSWSPWPGPRGCFGALSGPTADAAVAARSNSWALAALDCGREVR